MIPNLARTVRLILFGFSKTILSLAFPVSGTNYKLNTLKTTQMHNSATWIYLPYTRPFKLFFDIKVDDASGVVGIVFAVSIGLNHRIGLVLNSGRCYAMLSC